MVPLTASNALSILPVCASVSLAAFCMLSFQEEASSTSFAIMSPRSATVGCSFLSHLLGQNVEFFDHGIGRAAGAAGWEYVGRRGIADFGFSMRTQAPPHQIFGSQKA